MCVRGTQCPKLHVIKVNNVTHDRTTGDDEQTFGGDSDNDDAVAFWG